MKGPFWAWYLVIGSVVLAPAGVRMWTWSRPRAQPLDPQTVQAGQTLFLHEWTAHDPLASGGGDGLGPVFNADSCVFCHNQGGVGGAGGLAFNVTTFVYRSEAVAAVHRQPREGVVHAFAVNRIPEETLNHLHPSLPSEKRPTLSRLVSLSGNSSSNHCISVPSDVRLSQRNTPALFGANLIDAIPDREIIANEKRERLRWGLASGKSDDLPIGRALRLADGRVGHFGWKGQSPSLSAFVQAACANELGLSNPGQAQPRPLSYPEYQSSGYDLTLEQCDQITAFVAALPRPVEKLPDDAFLRGKAVEGKQLFNKVGCADCHVPKIGKVEGIYSDLLLHDMGTPLEGGGSYNDSPTPPPDPNKPPSPNDGPSPGEWRTPPLWGVADSAPYLHDGRAATLEDAIRLHDGQGKRSASKFFALDRSEAAKVIAFLQTLRAP